MIKFIHTADIHFGMENYGRIDPTTGIHSRLLDFERALNYCIDQGIEQDIDFFLFSGDAYKTAHPSPTQQKLLLRCFLRLYKAGIPIVIIVGNHDNPLSFGKSSSLEIFSEVPLTGFHVIEKPELLKLETKSGPIQIVGIPWPTRNTISLNKKHMGQTTEQITSYITQAVTAIIEQLASQCDPTIPSVLAGHLTVSSGVFSGSEKRAIYGSDPVFMPSQLAIEPFDYVGLGHLHRHQNLNPNGYPAIVYSGSIERIDFGERKEPKGFCLVSAARKATTYQFIEGPTRPFIQIDVELKEQNEAQDETKKTPSQTQQILTAIAKHRINDAVLKIVYIVPAGEKDTVQIEMVERACIRAQYVVGIIPIYHTLAREKRRNFKIDMDLTELLTAYCQDKPNLQNKKNLFMQKALEIYALAESTIEEQQE